MKPEREIRTEQEVWSNWRCSGYNQLRVVWTTPAFRGGCPEFNNKDSVGDGSGIQRKLIKSPSIVRVVERPKHLNAIHKKVIINTWKVLVNQPHNRHTQGCCGDALTAQCRRDIVNPSNRSANLALVKAGEVINLVDNIMSIRIRRRILIHISN